MIVVKFLKVRCAATKPHRPEERTVAATYLSTLKAELYRRQHNIRGGREIKLFI